MITELINVQLTLNYLIIILYCNNLIELINYHIYLGAI